MLIDYTPHNWTECREYLRQLSPDRFTVGARKSRHVVLDLAAGFDIETTSFYVNGEKRACMYIWQFAIEGTCFYGRTWEEYDQFLKILEEELGLSEKVVLRVYVHNLAFEFQFLRRRYEWRKVFSVKRLCPIVAATGGIEYRCSYRLTNLSLANAAENIHIHKIQKQIGKLDYNLHRHSGTPLTQDELDYCVYDVLILTALIDQKRQDEAAEGGNITTIPMTATGYIRRMCRNACYADPKFGKWIKKLRLTKFDYEVICQLRAGGFTHANEIHSGKLIFDVESRDIASSYPTVCISELFPMSPFTWEDLEYSEDDLKQFEGKSWMALVEWTEGLINRTEADSAMSQSKTALAEGAEIDNGRIRTADRVAAWITDVDWDTFKRMYWWSAGSVRVHKLGWAYRGRLPKPIAEIIRKLYYEKTKLKHSDPVIYLHAKELLNSIFGMMYTDPIRDNITYDTYDPALDADRDEQDWHIVKAGEQQRDIEEELEYHNNARNRFTFYPWGVWITAYARNRLFRVMSKIGADYIYSDTDSLKIKNAADYLHIFEQENALIDEKIKAACEYYDMQEDAFSPTDDKDETHPLGHWEFDGAYKAFKTLGAKRYMYQSKPRKNSENDIYTTVAGCGKEGLARFLFGTGDPFGQFEDGLTVPGEFSQRLAHAYGDYEISGELTDYLGQTGQYHEMSFVHMEPTTYTLGLDYMYADYIKNGTYTEIQTDNYI